MKQPKIVRINDIIDQILLYHPEADVELIRKAYVFSAKVHHGQTRLSGEPYLNHPLFVGKIIADLNLDEYSLATGLLHDTVEDTHATIEEIEEIFGPEVAFLVDGVTKITEISDKSGLDKQAENFRKMMFAMSKDIRVILIKLADRVHNMRTLQYLPPEKQKKIAQQTLDIYAPLANRLGLFLIKKELEDLSIRYIHEEVFNEIEQNLVITAEQREKYVHEVYEIIKSKLKQFSIEAEVFGRPKHIFSIYNKMLKQNLDFSQIYDLTAFRIIVKNRRECFEVLGIIHSIWNPIPGRFKDYISLPKANMYQSLHTTVIGPYGQRIEIQIRTDEMDRVAKHGIAAHWKYKEGRKIDQKDDQRFAWLQQVMESQREVKDSRDFFETFRVDIFPDVVYVFTPAGEVIDLPKGSTPIDFAYRIHSDIGHRCIGSKVNGIIATLKTHLKSGDVIEILTASKHKPSRDWLKFVITSRAKTKIRQWIKQQESDKSITLGRDICEKEFRKNKLSFTKVIKENVIDEEFKSFGIKSNDDLFASVGQGRISAKQVVNKFIPGKARDEKETAREKTEGKRTVRKREDGIRINGIDDVMVRYGRCCNPIPGDRIMGYITRGRGVTIHAFDCPFIENAVQERVIEAQWDDSFKHAAVVPIEVICEDKKGLLADISACISAGEANIITAKVKTTPYKKAVNIFEIQVNNIEQLEQVFHSIRKIAGVLKVSRVRS